MAVTSQLKPQVDLPVWEWMRFVPNATTGVSCFTTAGQGDNRYVYYLVSNLFWRYDTYTDGWQALATPPITVASSATMKYTSQHGYYGRVLAAGASSFTCAALTGQALKGYTVRIISGTGAGQERVISSVADPVIADTWLNTVAGTQFITDSTKTWKSNRWVGYQIRPLYGTGTGQVRKVVSNTSTVINVSDINYYCVSPWSWGAQWVTQPTNSSGFGVVESSVVTVSAPWTVQPDSTSEFMVLSGGIFLITQSPVQGAGFSLTYYDILADLWYTRNVPGVFWSGSSGVQNADVLETMSEANQNYLASAVTSATASTLVDSGQTLAVNRFANFAIKITGGTGIGQVRGIIANSATAFYVNRPWTTTPDATSTYAVIGDYDKLFLTGNGAASMIQYSVEADMWSLSKFYDFGVSRSMSARRAGTEPIGITSLVRTTGGITVFNATPTAAGSGYHVDDILTVSTGGASGRARVTSVGATGNVLAIALENPGSAYTTGTGKATTVTPAGGAGCTVEIQTIAEIATATTPINHPFMIGDSVTVAGANQSDYNVTATILGADTATTFAYVVANSPTTPATFTAQSSTVMVDATKNWATNEHVGKLVMFTDRVTAAANTAGTSALVKVLSNTATTITYTSLGYVAITGQSRYAITDMKFWGCDSSAYGPDKTGDGIATGGSGSTLVDTSKNWPINLWTGRKVRIIAGTGIGQEVAITSNTATTLTVGAFSPSPDATSVYSVEDCYGVATGGSTSTLIDTTQNWNTNWFLQKRVRIAGGTGGASAANQDIAITSHTATTLTFGPLTTGPIAGTPYSIIGIGARGVSGRILWAFNQTDTANKGKYIFAFRGGVSSVIDRYNIATERWDTPLIFPYATETLTTGSMYCYDGADRIYFTKDATGRVFYLDVVTDRVDGFGMVPYGMGAALGGNRMEVIKTSDGLKFLYIARHTGTELWRTLIFV